MQFLNTASQEAFPAIFEGLLGNTTLKYLEFKFASVNPNTQYLEQFLQQTTSLEDLVISGDDVIPGKKILAAVMDNVYVNPNLSFSDRFKLNDQRRFLCQQNECLLLQLNFHRS